MPPRAITDFEEEAPEEKFGGTLQPIQAKYDKVFDDAVAKMGTTTPTRLDEQDGFDMPDSSGPPPPTRKI